MKRILVGVLTIALLLSSVVSISATSDEEQATDDEENYGYISDGFDRLTANIEGDGLSAPECYDPRQSGVLTDVKNQGWLSLCWMYSTTSAAEQCASTFSGRKFNVSPEHGAVAMSDSVKYNIEDGNGDGYKNGPNNGAVFSKATQYFTNWQSPIFSSDTHTWNSTVSQLDYPYSKLDNMSVKYHNSVNIDSNFTDSQSLFNVTDAKYIAKDSDTIKNAIINYGSVITPIHNDPSLRRFDPNNDVNYLSNGGDLRHQVIIVGWDDNYSKDNFLGTYKPQNNGAWLVKNSAGTGGYVGDGYFWMSYEEPSIHSSDVQMSAITGVKKASDNERMLSYDYFELGSKDFSTNNSVLLSNVYDVSNYTNTYNRISSVMTYLKTTGCTYTVRIAQLVNSALPTNISNYSVLATGHYAGEGYVTINLDNDYYFSSTNKCAVIIQLTPDSSNSKIYLPTEHSDRSVVSASGESYLSVNADNNNISWIEAKNEKGYDIQGNFCIRPILRRETNSVHNIELSKDKIMDTGNDETIMVNSDSPLYSIRTTNNHILRQDIDYTIDNSSNVTIKNSFISALNGQKTDLIFEFNNDINKTVTINPLSTITSTTIQGIPAVGQVLTANCIGDPVKDNYTLNYQWQSSINGVDWYDIANANDSQYTVTNNDFSRYIRVKTTSQRYGNVVFPMENYSNATSSKIVYFGDVNLDGYIDTFDATMIQMYLSGACTFSNEQFIAADVDISNSVTIMDCAYIQSYLSGDIESLPVI